MDTLKKTGDDYRWRVSLLERLESVEKTLLDILWSELDMEGV